MPKLFISYRRQDSGPLARRLAETLSRIFGEDQVFLDTDSIRMGQDWPQRIHSSLMDAGVLMPVIGPQWLHIHNEYGERRIDLDGDWVRDEILTSLRRGIAVIPILVSGASPLKERALPEPLRQLSSRQAYVLRDEYWRRDIAPIVNELVQLGFARFDSEGIGTDVVFPAAIDESRPLTKEELDDVLHRLPEWKLVKRAHADDESGKRTELYRAFRFRSFEDAIHFMLVAARYASQHGHHPDWQNLWITVRVWLTTWDIGHKPSFKDARMAEYFENLYVEYVPQKSKRTPRPQR